MKKLILLLLITLICVGNIYAKVPKNKFESGELPDNVFIISQSSEMEETYITAIDLDKNELVIIRIDFDGMYWCYRTGMKCDPDKQMFKEGKSAPFKTE